MRTFVTIWLGQMVSTLGSAMTAFAFTLWVWQLTGSATALALFGFFSESPRIVITLFAGIIVDRFNRKYLMILGDTVAVLCTAVVGLLYLSDRLQVWHLYGAVALHSSFGHIQNLAYTTAVTGMVPEQHYTRASSMTAMVQYAAVIVAPALASSLYPILGLSGIILIDIISFTVAISTVLAVFVPQPIPFSSGSKTESAWQSLTFGLRYIWARPSLLAMTIAFSLFWFTHQLGEILYQPLILARTGGNAALLGVISTAAGIGGVLGGLILSIWGGFKPRIHGMLLGFIGTGLSKLAFSLGQIPLVWIPAKLGMAMHSPLIFSSSNAIWYAKVSPDVQGRVFAADHLIGLMIGAVTAVIAGPLADTVFEPAMQPGGYLAPLFGVFVGTGAGAGMALLYGMTALCTGLLGIAGYTVQRLRQVETLIPDHNK